MLPRALLIPHNADFEPGNSQLIGRANGAFSDRTGASWEKSEIRNPKEIRMTEISVWRKKRLSQQGCRRSRPAFKGQREIRIPLSLSNEQRTRNTPVQRDEPDRILPGQFNEVTIRDRLWLLHKR